MRNFKTFFTTMRASMARPKLYTLRSSHGLDSGASQSLGSGCVTKDQPFQVLEVRWLDRQHRGKSPGIIFSSSPVKFASKKSAASSTMG